MVVTAFESVGKWLAAQLGVAKLASVVFWLGMSMYLFISAAICIRLFTGVPVFVQLIVWVALSTPLRFGSRPARTVLGSRTLDTLKVALLMLGTAYRVSGHASAIIVLALVAHWSLVLLAYREES